MKPFAISPSSGADGTATYGYARALCDCLPGADRAFAAEEGGHDPADGDSEPTSVYMLGDDWHPSDASAMLREPGIALAAVVDGRAVAEDEALCEALAVQRAIIVPTEDAFRTLSRRLPGSRVCHVPPICVPLSGARRAACGEWRARGGLAHQPVIAVPDGPQVTRDAEDALDCFARLRLLQPDAWMIVFAGARATVRVWDLPGASQHVLVLPSRREPTDAGAFVGADLILLPAHAPSMSTLMASLQGLSAGIPVVSACADSACLPRPVLRVAETAYGQAFGWAAALDYMLTNSDARERLAGVGRDYLEAHHSQTVVAGALARALTALRDDSVARQGWPSATGANSDSWATRSAGRALAGLGVTDEDAALLTSAASAIGSLSPLARPLAPWDEDKQR